MQVSITETAVVGPASTITLAGLNEGEVRRFRRIFESWVAGTHYPGSLTAQFAGAVNEALNE